MNVSPRAPARPLLIPRPRAHDDPPTLRAFAERSLAEVRRYIARGDYPEAPATHARASSTSSQNSAALPPLADLALTSPSGARAKRASVVPAHARVGEQPRGPYGPRTRGGPTRGKGELPW